MNETKREKERVVIFAVHQKSQDDFQFQETLNETQSLCETAGLDVVGQYMQNRERADTKTYLGKGRIEEITEEVSREDISFDVIIVNDELTTSQSRHLADIFAVKIIDRTQLILDIFAQRAKSREGQLQVELAQNEYMLPRLSGHGISLSRLGGGIGTRGPGETKLETNRRHIRSRIHDIKVQLEEIKAHRKRYREQRKKSQIFQIALVGYTNAGKSSWFNQLTQSETFEQDLLFATLDPKSKVMQINEGFKVIVSDTVGFIQHLPTHLIEAFSSTLEEAKYADVLIHVVDRSHPNYDSHMQTVNELLASLQMGSIPTLTLLNKSDLIDSIQEDSHNTLVVSSRDHDDVQRVKTLIAGFVETLMTPYHIDVQPHEGRIINRLREDTMVTSIEYDEEQDLYHIVGVERPESGTVNRILKIEKSEQTDE